MMNDSKIFDVKELFGQEFAEKMLDLRLRHYNGDFKPYRYVAYDSESDTIDIKTDLGGIYDVPLDRCKTAAACLDWIHQLHVKAWFTEEHEKEFIDLLLRLIPTELWSGKA